MSKLAVLLSASLVYMLGCRQPDQIQTYTVPKEPKATPVANTSRTAPGEPTDRMLTAILPADGIAWFFKIVGPTDQIDAREKEISEFFAGVSLGEDGKPKWKLPDGWKEEPGNQFRLATIVLPGDKRLEITVSSATWAGAEESLLPNVNRWRDQLQLPDIGQEKLTEVSRTSKAGDHTITIVDMRGRFSGGMAAPFARGRFDSKSAGASDTPGLPPGHPPIAASPNQPTGARAGLSTVPRPIDSSRATDSAGVPKFTPAPSWKQLPATGLKKAEFAVSDGEKEARVALTTFRTTEGSLIADPLANINRWRGEIGLNPIDKEALAGATESLEVDGRPATVAAMIPDAAKPEESKLPEATVAAIVKDGDTLWFVKMRGDRDVVKKNQAEFKTFLKSLKFPRGGATGDGNN